MTSLTVRAHVESARGDDLDWSCWAPLDESLLNEETFPLLRELNVELAIKDSCYAENHRILLRECLPKLTARGYLNISVEF